MFGRIFTLLGKEFAQLLQDKALLGIILYGFTIAIYTAASVFIFEPREASVIILDHSRSEPSRELVHKLQEPHFEIRDFVSSEADIERYLMEERAALALVIPPDFQERLPRGDAQVELVLDGTMSVTATMAAQFISSIVHDYGVQLRRRHGIDAAGPSLTVHPRPLFNPDLKHEWFGGLIEFLFMMTIFGMLLTAAALVREKEHGTLEQLAVSPASSFEILVAKLMMAVIVCLIFSTLSLFGIIQTLFGFPINQQVFLFYGATALFLFTMSGLGVAIAAVTENISQATLALILLLTPMLFLSGVVMPVENLPGFMYWGSYIFPLRYYLEISFATLVRGAGFFVVAPQLLLMTVLGLFFFAFSVYYFHRTV